MQPGQSVASGSHVRGSEVTDAPDRTVWVLRGNKPVSVPIRIGRCDGTASEVASSMLREGDFAITDATVAGKYASLTASPQGANAGASRMGRMF